MKDAYSFEVNAAFRRGLLTGFLVGFGAFAIPMLAVLAVLVALLARGVR